MGTVLELRATPVRTEVEGRLHRYVDVPVHYFVSDGRWGYRFDNPSILGGGLATRQDAVIAAVDALERALAGDGCAAADDEVVGHVIVELRGVC